MWITPTELWITLLSNRYRFHLYTRLVYVSVLLSVSTRQTERTEKGQQMKLNLGNKQIETLEEMMNVAINLLEGVEEYKADQKRYEALRASVEAQLAKRGN